MITAEPPQVTLSGKYSIGEAANKLGIHRGTLLKHTEAGLIKCGWRRTGRKFYTGTEIMRYWKAEF